jgi:hypothetical protein
MIVIFYIKTLFEFLYLINRINQIELIMSDLNKTATALLAELLIQNKQQFELFSQDVQKLSNATSYDALKNKIVELEAIIKQNKSDEAKNQIIYPIVRDNEKDHKIACLEKENQELKQNVNQLMDEKELQQNRMSKYLLGNMTYEEIKKEYQMEFKELDDLYKKYNYDTYTQSDITYHITYVKMSNYNNWFVVIRLDDEIKDFGKFLAEYFELTVWDPRNGNPRLQMYLQEQVKDEWYSVRCSHEMLDNKIIPLSNYSRIYPQYSLMDYELDILNHHTITFNGEKYSIRFPIEKILDYQEYQNVAAYIAYNTSSPDTNYEELRKLDLLKDYNDGLDIIVEISKKRFMEYYVPKFKPTRETLLKLLDH